MINKYLLPPFYFGFKKITAIGGVNIGEGVIKYTHTRVQYSAAKQQLK